MDPVLIGGLGLAMVIFLIFLGSPTAVNMLMVGFFGTAMMRGWSAALFLPRHMTFTVLSSFNWSVIPLFMLMGFILFETGIGQEVFYAVRQWLGHIPGGIAISVSGACALIGTMTGSGYATTALMARVAYPEMRKYNYQPDLGLAVCAASGTAAMMIPPSISIVGTAIVAEVSIASCLLAGFIPGFLSMGVYMVMIWFRCRRRPELGPPQPPAAWGLRLKSLRYLIPVIVMILTIVGGIYFGVFTATEAAGMGALASIILALGMRRLTWDRMKKTMLETARMSLLLFLVLMAALGFYTRFLIYSGLTITFAEIAIGLPSRWITLGLIIVIMFVFGMFVGGPQRFVTIPIFAPVIRELGWSVVWFVILFTKFTECGAITPPVCMTVFIAQGIIGEVSMEKAYAAVWPFVICDVFTAGLLVAFPQIALWLPSTARGAPV